MIKIRQLAYGLFFIHDLFLSTIKVQQETKINIILSNNFDTTLAPVIVNDGTDL